VASQPPSIPPRSAAKTSRRPRLCAPAPEPKTKPDARVAGRVRSHSRTQSTYINAQFAWRGARLDTLCRKLIWLI